MEVINRTRTVMCMVALQGMTFQDLFEFKKMEDYFIDVDDWKKCLFTAESGQVSHT